MRSGLAAGLMGIGGILLAFGATITVIAIFTRTSAWRGELPAMISVATASLLVGGVMFAAGFLFHRMGRGSGERATT